MPRTLRLAILFSFLFHGALILLGRYHTSYDAYVHMFFGDHYRMDWWSLWDPRWYTGFYVTSYPPLIHQLIGLLSHPIGLDAAFAMILWITLTLLPLSVFLFVRVFAGNAVAGYASLSAAFLPSVYLTAHIFGQLPTLAATTTALIGSAALAGYLRTGSRLEGALAISLMGTTMAFHHATLLLLPWLILAVTLHLLRKKKVHWKHLAMRLFIAGGLSAPVILLVIWPFWEWGRTQTIQTPIDHASRHNFFQDPVAALIFFLPMYGPLMFLIPFVPAILRQRKWIGLGISFAVLFLLGLGGTTPLPRWFFGANWEWLTYDRFAFWASLMLLPFLGTIVIVLRRRQRRNISRKIFLSLALTSIIVGLATTVLPLQPGAVDMDQLVDFLEEEDRSRWRYLTFGFGDQLALLSTRTTATTIDGSYHTARTLPELRSSGVGQIDTAFWLKDGLSALDPILQKAGHRGVRWGFVNIPQYMPILEKNGWIKLRTLESGVQVWENPGAVIPERSQPPGESLLASFSWGALPLLSLVTTLSLATLRVWPLKAEKFLRSLQAFLVGLIPVSLCFWYFRTLGEFPHERVYFTYDHALIFLGDALALLVIVLWLSMRVARPSTINKKYRLLPSSFILLLALVLLSSLSILWSSDWRTSLYNSAHLGLIFLLILSLRDGRDVWKPAMLGLCGALVLQIMAGFVGFALQSTSFLAPLELIWPGSLDPSMRGAVVVGLADGTRVLRAYGTLPHPNILGGFTLISLLGPVSLFLIEEKPNYQALILFALGIALLALTFSRSAWLGLLVFSLMLVWKSNSLDRKRVGILLSTAVLSFLITLLHYPELVLARTANIASNSEKFSFIGRTWLNGEALQVMQEHPLTGVGIGSFIIDLAQRAGEGYIVEPVHNIFLLAGTELGMPGLLLVLGLFISIAWRFIKVQTPRLILASAALAGFGVISLFDHYLWSLAPGRLMLGFALGLWAGNLSSSPSPSGNVHEL
ncbi:MAG TPA: O-antigen ligase family protein [Anaerolineales bacterium]|nr:O-antigen ligase family protein [Anaerolineales bacterium]